MTAFLETLNGIVWGVPALIMILGVGIYLSIRTGFAQIRLFPKAVKTFKDQFISRKKNHNGVSSYRALCTALGATVGTGNLAGVAGAIALGGPGSIFWMWVCGFLGMATKFAEAVLAIRYRKKSGSGEYIGGPMYMIEQGMPPKIKWLAGLYCYFGVVASFGVGNATQINAVIGGINSVIVTYGGNESKTGNLIMGVVLAALVLILLLGGAKRIGAAAENLVPFAAGGYILLAAFILIVKAEMIPAAFCTIVKGAFDPRAVTGGVLGSAAVSVRVGASRGTFTNEAGMGTASIAHASAQVKHPVEQGLMGIMEVFLDTIVICTMTALVILCSGVYIPYGSDVGVTLTSQSFSSVCGDWVCIPIAIALCCFAVATVLGWGLYGARCTQYLFGDKAWKRFAFAQAGVVVIGAVLRTGTVWLLSEIVNGLMAIPNLIALTYLSPELSRLISEYDHAFKKKSTRP